MLNFVLNDSIELLEIMSDGRAFHSLAVVGKKLFPKVLDERYYIIHWHVTFIALKERRGYSKLLFNIPEPVQAERVLDKHAANSCRRAKF